MRVRGGVRLWGICKCKDALASGSVVGIVNITSDLELSEALYL